MKYLKYFFSIFLFVSLSGGIAQTNKNTASAYIKENKSVADFINTHFGKGKIPPFSFIYNGENSEKFIRDWSFSEETKVVDNNITEKTYSYTDKKTGLVVRCICSIYNDYPAIELVLKLKNTSQDSTPLIEQLQTVMSDFKYPGKEKYILHTAKGSNAAKTDFAPVDNVLVPGADISFGPNAGRSSDTEVLPFFNIDASDEGIMVGIGWSGRWLCDVKRDSAGVITLSAGFRKIHLKLLAGEEIRTPKVLLLFWQGNDRMIGHNMLRRFILAHHTPQKDGKPVLLPLTSGIGYGGPSPCNEYSCATETYAIATANRLIQFGIHPEAGWIDAGWYDGSEQSWVRGAGNWTVNKKNFPNGIRPVSDELKKLGMGLVLWFEPERVYQGTKIYNEHPEWLLKIKNNVNSLFDLGNTDARKWMTDFISDFIEKEGVTIYRQDFNFDPLPYWEVNDAPDRQGISEIKHIEGLYMFWDELLARNPGLLIDNCASGGRRFDLETISRSISLCRTDYPSSAEPNGAQCHTYGLSFYLPCASTGTTNPSPYYFRSVMASGLGFGWDLNNSGFPLEQAKASLEEFNKYRLFFYGDYYPLTEYSSGDDVWMAYQFSRPAQKDGIIFAFRRNACNNSTINVKLRGLDDKAQYEINFEDYGIKFVKSGKELLEGFDINIPQAPGSLIIYYLQK